MGVDSGQWAAGDIASDVAAGASGAETDSVETIENFGDGFDADPMELNVLAHRDVRDTVAVFGREISDGAELVAGEEAVGNADANHEERGGLTFSAGAADHPQAVALGVDAPGAKVGAEPLVGNRGVALTGELANFIEMVPGVFFAFEAFDALGFGFLDFGHMAQTSLTTRALPQKVGATNDLSRPV